jgi:hypothetical protein
MPVKLTLTQQRQLYRALPASRKLAVKKTCKECSMRGDGLMDILKKVGNALGAVGKELGPTVLREIVFPLVLKKYRGSGLTLPGRGDTKKSVVASRRKKIMPKHFLY